MTLNFIREIWDTLTNYMITDDRRDAASDLVNLLIDNDYDADDILAGFRSDRDIRNALQDHVDTSTDEDEEIEEDYDYDHDDYEE